jgi:DNA polymerase
MSLDELRTAAAGCTACDQYRHATQTDFGEDAPHARLMLMGEQPDDREDVESRPFVGQAGRPLDRALAQGGTDRSLVHVTNVVKRTFRVTKERGRPRELEPGSRKVVVTATVHPSSILRAPDDDTRSREFDAFVADLETMAQALHP